MLWQVFTSLTAIFLTLKSAAFSLLAVVYFCFLGTVNPPSYTLILGRIGPGTRAQ